MWRAAIICPELCHCEAAVGALSSKEGRGDKRRRGNLNISNLKIFGAEELLSCALQLIDIDNFRRTYVIALSGHVFFRCDGALLKIPRWGFRG